MKMATPHVHAELISEWLVDTSRIVQTYDLDGVWKDAGEKPTWDTEAKYRFKPREVALGTLIAPSNHWVLSNLKAIVKESLLPDVNSANNRDYLRIVKAAIDFYVSKVNKGEFKDD